MASPDLGQWIAHLSPEGRPFWNHSISKQSVWEKPTELKTPVEREMEKTGWKEYESGGRKYWVSESKETTWDMPAELLEILARSAPPTGPSARPLPSSLPSAPAAFVPQQQQQQQQQQQSPIPLGLNSSTGALVAPGGGGFLPQRPSFSAVPPQPTAIPEFQSHSEAESAFIQMLKDFGVTTTWSWEQTMRETITEPLYKALKTLAERKSAFEKYVRESKQNEIEEREKSLAGCRKDWTKALERMGGGTDKEDGVKSWWTWENAKSELERRLSADVWKGPRDDFERRTLFEEFINALKIKDATRKSELRAKNMEKVTVILRSLSLDLAGSVKWRDAQSTLSRTPEWQNDSELQIVDPIDVLTIFEEEVKKAERESNDTRKRLAEEKRRRERKSREKFVELLEELKIAGQITADSSWKSIYPLLASDERFENLLGNPGSAPLDLFWDMIDELQYLAEESQKVVERILDDRKEKVTEDTKYEEFVKVLEGDARLEQIDYAVIKACYDKLYARAVRVAKEDRKRSEKKLRLQIDDLRYAFKKLDPPVDLEATYEEILPRIEYAQEFVVIEDEQARRTAFEKFVKRQKEKLKEKEVADSKESRRDRDSSPRHKDRSDKKDKDSDLNRSSIKRERGNEKLTGEDGRKSSSSKRRRNSTSSAKAESGEESKDIDMLSLIKGEFEEGEIE